MRRRHRRPRQRDVEAAQTQAVHVHARRCDVHRRAAVVALRPGRAAPTLNFVRSCIIFTIKSIEFTSSSHKQADLMIKLCLAYMSGHAFTIMQFVGAPQPQHGSSHATTREECESFEVSWTVMQHRTARISREWLESHADQGASQESSGLRAAAMTNPPQKIAHNDDV